MSEIFKCKHCGEEHEATTEEIASYLCPKLRKTKVKPKLLDQERFNKLTKELHSENDSGTTHSLSSDESLKENL